MQPHETSNPPPLRTLLEGVNDWPARWEASTQQGLDPGFPRLPDLALPEGMRALGPFPPEARTLAQVRDGCYDARFLPDAVRGDLSAWPALVGTLRLEALSPMHWVASADLYRCEGVLPAAPTPDGLAAGGFGPGFESAHGPRSIPSYSRDRYHGYMTLGPTRIVGSQPASEVVSPEGRSVVLDGDMTRLRSVEFGVWDRSEPVLLRLRSVEAESAAPDRKPKLVFSVSRPGGLPLGTLEFQWIAEHFREATVELDAEIPLPVPSDNGGSENWTTVFARAGWLVHQESGRLRMPTPRSGRWTVGELHAAMVSSRESSDLDLDWRYHVTAVRWFADVSAPLGIAFDHEATDLNDVPREGVAVNAGARIPDLAVYGPYRGRIVHECPDLYFKIAVHEVGHAMGLHHNHIGYGLMEQVHGLARSSSSGALGPAALAPVFATDDLFRLRHLPDIYVRPGGTPWETLGLVEDRDHAHAEVPRLHLPRLTEPSGSPLVLLVTPVRDGLPVGAPLRVNFSLFNPTGSPVEVPARLSLSTPFVRGWVEGPDGRENEFRSLFKSIAAEPPVMLGPGMAHTGSLTLIRGRSGALFGRPGRHVLNLEVSWSSRGETWCHRARVPIDVTGPGSAAEERVARRVKATPEVLGYLVLGKGTAFRAGEMAVEQALGSAAYAPHFAYVHAKALADLPKPDATVWSRVADLLRPETHRSLLNLKEREKAIRLQELADRGTRTSPDSQPHP